MSYAIFHDRKEAGILLSDKLAKYAQTADTIILALPRGGVPVAYEIAQKLNLPLDVFIVRKLGVPYQEELAMGAIASGDVTFLNEPIINQLQISENDIEKVRQKELSELKRREAKYHQHKKALSIKNKTILLVDDGIATGATVNAAIKALKKLGADKIILAVPVIPPDTLNELMREVDALIYLETPEPFYGVGMWYENFPQTSDDEVCALLK